MNKILNDIKVSSETKKKVDIFFKKDKIQNEALNSWRREEYNSILAMCTGSGKSRCGVLAAKKIANDNPKARILIIVPTETLRDKGWAEEFEKWECKELYDINIERSCYVSINKIKKKKYDLVIMDECHRITVANHEFFKQNKVEKILGLTATPPEDDEKKDLLKSLRLKISYNYSLDQGVKDGVVAPFDIHVVEMRLSDKKDFKVTTKANKNGYITSERSRYDALTNVINKIMYSGKNVPMYMFLNRMRFLYDLPSKTKLAKELIKSKFDKDERFLIFCGSIKQAEELCQYRYHSKTDSKDLDRLKSGKINKLSCIKALNEGENIPNMDSALIVQLSSKSLDLIQRVGRIVRIREGHRAKIWIICAVDTKDEDWVNKALEPFNKENITYHHIKNLNL